MTGNKELEMVANFAVSMEGDSDTWILRTLTAGDVEWDVGQWADEVTARVRYADAVEDVRTGDLVAAILYHRIWKGEVPDLKTVAAAWDEDGSLEDLALLPRNILDDENDAAWPYEKAYYYVTRADGKTAWLKSEAWSTFRDCDVWSCIDVLYPRAYDLIEPDMLTVSDCQQSYDEIFGDGLSAQGLEDWIREGDSYKGSLEDSDATITASKSEKIAVVTWTVEGIEVSQSINLNEGDYERIAGGADPAFEGWEDGDGHEVCIENASGDIPEDMREKVMNSAVWEPWWVGDSADEMVQDGIWEDLKVRAVYRIPDPEAFEEAEKENESEAYLNALISLRIVPGWIE